MSEDGHQVFSATRTGGFFNARKGLNHKETTMFLNHTPSRPIRRGPPKAASPPAAPSQPASAGREDVGEPIDWEAKYKEALGHSRDWEKKAKANKAAADELEKLKEASMTEQEKAAKHVKELEDKVASYETAKQRADWKAQVSAETGVPADVIEGDSLKPCNRVSASTSCSTPNPRPRPCTALTASRPAKARTRAWSTTCATSASNRPTPLSPHLKGNHHHGTRHQQGAAPQRSSHRHYQARQDTSTIAALSPSEPQLFLDKDYMVFTGNSEAEVVAEGAQKSSYEETPHPGRRQTLQGADHHPPQQRAPVGRRRRQTGNHQQNPGQTSPPRWAASSTTSSTTPSTPRRKRPSKASTRSPSAVSVPATDDRVADIDSLAEAVSDEYDINGIALSKTMANELRKIAFPPPASASAGNPDQPQVGNLDGIPAATSGTVNGRLVTPATGILAFLGDFRLIKWGMVRDIWSEIIEYGDPDNTGKDLKGVNQIAYRTEAMYSYAILDPKGIAVLKKPTSTGRAAK